MEFKAGKARVAINVPSWAVLEDTVRQRFAQRDGFALATLNLDHLVKLRNDPAFAEAYAAQDLVVADGNPLVWLARWAGKPVELIPGSDAIIPLCRIAADLGVPVGMVGSTEDSLMRARNHLIREVEGLNVTCLVAPPFGFDPEGYDAQNIFVQLRTQRVRLCFVALGAPKQERFAAAGRRAAPEIGFASIGAGLDFFSGTQKRAPTWVRKLALEWLWRLVQQPRRMGPRYAQCVSIFPGHLLRSLSQRS